MVPTVEVLQERAFATAAAKGWWENGAPHDSKSIAEKLLLMNTEVSEAFEDIRARRAVSETFYTKKAKMKLLNPITCLEEEREIEFEVPKGTPGAKPCGVPSELADVVIRILDFCGAYGIDLQGMILEKMAFNDTREYRHGGKAA
jgi:NTP pyrophosphatase (non-canonical NTP hydrolase)